MKDFVEMDLPRELMTFLDERILKKVLNTISFCNDESV